MTQTVEEIAGKLQTGQLSFADAESLLNRLSPVMADWPLMAASVQTWSAMNGIISPSPS